MQQAIDTRPAPFGFIGFMMGIVALVILLIQMSAFFEPQEKSTGTMIGEVAADIKMAAKRALSGEPAQEPAPAPAPRDYTRAITIAALCIAGIAVALGAVGLYRNEPHRHSYMAIGIGLSAFIMQYVFWLVILVCGVVLLVSILANLDSIFS